MTGPSAVADGGDSACRPRSHHGDDVGLDGFRQADILKVGRVPLLGPGDANSWHDTPDGVVILSQTCDVVQETKETIQVAPLVRKSAQRYGQARKGAMPGYVPVVGAGEDMYADLDHVATVHKAHIALLTPQRGFATTEDAKKFGMRVGRRYSRFAFPDEVSHWLGPLKDDVIGKADKPNSPLGRALSLVESLRLECQPNWDQGAPYSLTLLVLVEPESLPMLDMDEAKSAPDDLRGWTHDQDDAVKVTPLQAAGELLKPHRWEDRHARVWLWNAFAESLAARCRPGPGASPEVRGAIAGGAFESEVTTTEEVTYHRILRSEEIDVEHLSPPLPR